MQRIHKERHTQIGHNCRFLILQERFWDPCTEGPNVFRGLEVRPLCASMGSGF